jgi:hypothetical protein
MQAPLLSFLIQLATMVSCFPLALVFSSFWFIWLGSPCVPSGMSPEQVQAAASRQAACGETRRGLSGAVLG